MRLIPDVFVSNSIKMMKKLVQISKNLLLRIETFLIEHLYDKPTKWKIQFYMKFVLFLIVPILLLGDLIFMEEETVLMHDLNITHQSEMRYFQYETNISINMEDSIQSDLKQYFLTFFNSQTKIPLYKFCITGNFIEFSVQNYSQVLIDTKGQFINISPYSKDCIVLGNNEYSYEFKYVTSFDFDFMSMTEPVYIYRDLNIRSIVIIPPKIHFTIEGIGLNIAFAYTLLVMGYWVVLLIFFNVFSLIFKGF